VVPGTAPAFAADLVDGQVLETLLPNSPLTVSNIAALTLCSPQLQMVHLPRRGSRASSQQDLVPVC
jgi:hypothetical protein